MRRYRAFHKITKQVGEVAVIDFVGNFVKVIPCDFEYTDDKDEIVQFQDSLLTWNFDEIDLMEVL